MYVLIISPLHLIQGWAQGLCWLPGVGDFPGPWTLFMTVTGLLQDFQITTLWPQLPHPSSEGSYIPHSSLVICQVWGVRF